MTLALCEKENGRVLCASRWETVVFGAHKRAAEALHALHFVHVHAQGLACADAAALPY